MSSCFSIISRGFLYTKGFQTKHSEDLKMLFTILREFCEKTVLGLSMKMCFLCSPISPLFVNDF